MESDNTQNTNLVIEETDSLLARIKERAKKIREDYLNADNYGNGIDQDEAFGLANMISELDQKLSSGFFGLPSDWNKSNFELGFDEVNGF